MLLPLFLAAAVGGGAPIDTSGFNDSRIDRERRTGSGWFSPWPRRLMETDYPKWRAGVK